MAFQAMLAEAELKREEEKSKGGPNTGETASTADNNNQDIVLFDENEEEEEEEESDEEDEAPSRARGRGGANMLPWQPHMPPRGPAALGLRGFSHVMMGPADGFGFGPTDGFGMPDLFGMQPRVFPPFGGPRPGPIGFPGIRPGQPGPPMFPMGGLGMTMGPGGRGGPFMGHPGGIPMGPLGRPNRPMGMPPFTHPPSSGANRAGRRDQRRPAGDRQETGPERRDPDAGTDYEMEYQHGEGRNGSREEGSESEEEVGPRRQRHGESKRKRRGSDRDSASSDHRN